MVQPHIAAENAVDAAVQAVDAFPAPFDQAMAVAQVRALASIALAVDRLADVIEAKFPVAER